MVTALTTQFATTLKGIHVCNYQGLSMPPENHPITVLWGAETLKEQLCGLTFSITPTSFFQVNTEAAEVLYKQVVALAGSYCWT